MNLKHTTQSNTICKETTSANDELNDGWKSIDVFYGKSPHDDTNVYVAKWFSQVRQDEYVMTLFNNKTNGYFIDLAANQATYISNSYALERYYQWKGLCIEPNHMYWSDLAMFRKNCTIVAAVVGDQRMSEVFFRFDQREHGGIAGPGFDNVNASNGVKRYTIPLIEIFQRYNVPKEIDYFSLDVEGAEELILQNFPLHEYRIHILTGERLHNRPKIIELLTKNGLQFVNQISPFGETLWVHKSIRNTLNWSEYGSLYPQGLN